MNTTAQRVRLYSGEPPRDGSSMPTCGACKREIPRGEQYAGVLYEGDYSENGMREVRHNPGCVEWRAVKSAETQVGDRLLTFRFEQEGRGMYPVVVTKLDPADVDERGWRAVWGRDADDESAEPVKAYQSTDELVHLITPDQSAVRITINSTFTLPSNREGGRPGVERLQYDADDYRTPVEWAVETLRDAGCTRHNWGAQYVTEEPKVTDSSRGEEETKSASLEGFTTEQLQAVYAGMHD